MLEIRRSALVVLRMESVSQTPGYTWDMEDLMSLSCYIILSSSRNLKYVKIKHKNIFCLKNVMQNGQNSVAGSEAINGGMSGIIEKLIKSVTGNVS